MKKIHPLTSIAVLLQVSSFLSYNLNYTITALILSVLAFFAATAEVAKYTSAYQFVMVLLSAAFTGVLLDTTFETGPFLFLAIMIAALASVLRIMFFKFFSYTGYLWTELSLVLIAAAIYVTGFFIHGYTWPSMVFPSVYILFGLAFSLNTLKDNFQLLGGSRLGYQVKIGQAAVDFLLPDQDQQETSLSQFKGRVVLLIFVRGDWCPCCHMMLRTYEKNKAEFQKKDVVVMAIGPDPIGVNREMVEKLGLDYKVLSDEGQKTARVYGVQLKEYKNDFAPKQPDGIPLPASFLVDKEGIVRYVSSPARVGEYLNPDLIFSALSAVV